MQQAMESVTIAEDVATDSNAKWFISNVEVTNIMGLGGTHSFQFREGINCVTGDNGSGKSSLVSCIELVMGKKPGQLQRNDRIGDFVTEGREEGSMRVTLTDKEDRTRKVTLQRDITSSGSSKYSISVDDPKETKTIPLETLKRELISRNIPVNRGIIPVVSQSMMQKLSVSGKNGFDSTFPVMYDLLSCAKLWKEVEEKLQETDKNLALVEKGYNLHLTTEKNIQSELETARRNEKALKNCQELEELLERSQQVMLLCCSCQF